MDATERKKYDELQANGQLPAFRELIMSLCAPIWWEVGGHTVLHNGSMCIIQTPSSLFGVTNEHVLHQYEEDKATTPDAFCQLGSGPFDPSSNLISRSEHWDLATFRIPDLTLKHWNHQVWTAKEWPPPPIQEGQGLILGGYPENRRTQAEGNKPATMTADFVTFLARAQNWSEEHMSFCFDSNTWYWPQGEGLDPHPNLSGEWRAVLQIV
jgi:hypothetical protein